jgi:hypothetical protein
VNEYKDIEPYTRNTVDIGAVALVKKLSHLPVLWTPVMLPQMGHGRTCSQGRRWLPERME